MTDDGQLLRQYLQHQSEAAFAELVRRHLGLVYHAALRRLHGDGAAAEDVSQAVFLQLARKAPFLCGHPALAGWLYTAVNLEASVWIRGARRRQAREQDAAALLAAEAGTDALRDGRFLRPILDEALLALGSGEREAVLLRYLEGHSHAEVAQKLGISEAAAQRRVSRALDKLRGQLERRQVPSTSEALAEALTDQSILAAPSALATAIPAAVMAAGAQAGGGLASLIHLMSTLKLSAGMAGLLALASLIGTGAAGVGLYQLHRASGAAAAATAASAELDAKQESLRTLQRQAAAADKQLAAARQALAGAGAAAGGGRAGAAGAGRRAAGNGGAADVAGFFAANPDAKGLAARLAHAQVAAAFNPFFKSVSMSPAEIAQFEDLFVANALEHLTLSGAGLVPTELHPSDEQMRALLGDERYQQYQDFQQVVPAFALTRSAAVAAGMAGEPLSDGQQDQLVQALIKAGATRPAGNQMIVPDVNWDAAMSQAQALVSPTQWKAVKSAFMGAQLQAAALAAATSSAAPAVSR
ncbi:MAG TPA: sigma-70 family RNA polymerase sigma factor [Opitutaceae bacterium]|nr:sigma-70 family RNA polymerase sigma factor [Opitutaceae bacterium]